jgi:hypothetical protein
MKPTRHLRVVQVACVLLTLGCVAVSRFGAHEGQGTLTAIDWFVVAAAIWSAISGFTLQRRIVNKPALSRRSSPALTPFTRWRAGNLARLCSATAVSVWALFLREEAGPPWLVDVLFAAGLLLLLVWKPGVAPAETT